MSKIIKITAFFLFFVMCFCVKNVSAEEMHQHVRCCIDGKATWCNKPPEGAWVDTTCLGGLIRPDVGEFEVLYHCSSVGATQTKYTAGTCDYTTKERECCSNGYWSGWNEECPQTQNSCPEDSKPAETQDCIMASGAAGIQRREVTCRTSDWTWFANGWGVCRCKNSCSGRVLDASTCLCCAVGCYHYSGGVGTPYCDCMPNTITLQNTCCTMTDGSEYRLPNSYSSCVDFAEDMGLSLKTVISHSCSDTPYKPPR